MRSSAANRMPAASGARKKRRVRNAIIARIIAYEWTNIACKREATVSVTLHEETNAGHELVAAEILERVEALVQAVVTPFGVQLHVLVDGDGDAEEGLVVSRRAAAGGLEKRASEAEPFDRHYRCAGMAVFTVDGVGCREILWNQVENVRPDGRARV